MSRQQAHKASIRANRETLRKLRIIAALANEMMWEVTERLVDQEYERVKQSMPERRESKEKES